MFTQNFIKLSAAVHQLSLSQRKKNSDENNTVRRYRANSNKRFVRLEYYIPPDKQRTDSICGHPPTALHYHNTNSMTLTFCAGNNGTPVTPVSGTFAQILAFPRFFFVFEL